ncbi:hypothetical protein CU097_014917 [Rhizopus azygosporus]|jgi:hypothetical protein|uniref:Uncharacterized protein n=1 Tax=Rhizopus azygosporus TaxID=86630 RepID=A0A367K7G2_RHIAZ|nr:hypothetical protein CU097_014917 [Rhizopus azygosporus]
MIHRHNNRFSFILQKKPITKKSVKISKEPPMIVYFERDILEDTLIDYIFDPQVLHDEEKDHPDLDKKSVKPWQCPPYTSNSSFLTKLKSIFHKQHSDSVMSSL